MKKDPHEGDLSVDTDGDSVPDLEEITEKTIELPDWIIERLEAKYPGETFSKTIKLWAYKSHPGKKDTDGDGGGDGDSDDVGDVPLRPFEPALLLTHGIFSDTGSAYGLETYVYNHPPDVVGSREFNESIEDYMGRAVKDYDPEMSLGNDILEDVGKLKKGALLHYDQLKAQYIRNVRYGELGMYLTLHGFDKNNNLFVFNWESNGHLYKAAYDMMSYMKILSKKLKNENQGLVDTTLYDPGTEENVVQFNLIGHSAGG